MHPQIPSSLEITGYVPEYKTYFRDLNLEWITKYFKVEEQDQKVLNHPEEYILTKGGAVFFALAEGKVVGTCALIKENDTVYELAKMAVAPAFQGKKVGKKLCAYTIEKAIEAGAKKLVLITNSRLTAALQMYKKAGFYEVDFPHAERIYERGDLKMELDLATYKVKQAARNLQEIIQKYYPILQAIPEPQASFKSVLEKWSKKEILGHLIDSASNNQHKFVRTWQTDGLQFQGYSQDFWVLAQQYQQSDWQLLTELWKSYNLHLAHVMQQIPASVLQNKIRISEGEPVTLESIAVDYGWHLHHHLKQILPEMSDY